jgi:hypothetical protein
MRAKVGSDVTLQRRLGDFVLDGTLDPNRHERREIRPQARKFCFNQFVPEEELILFIIRLTWVCRLYWT